MYLPEKTDWWKFCYDNALIMNTLAGVRMRQGQLLVVMSQLGLNQQNTLMLHSFSANIVKSAEIEGELLNLEQVWSSIARRLGIQTAGLVDSPRYIDGVVEMMLDATQRYQEPLTDERLFGWHNTLFPTGRSGLYKIEVGCYRTHEMQVVSGPMGMERVHYEAPKPDRVPQEMEAFLSWINSTDTTDPLLRAAIAHLWFVTIHPFDDGNGRIGRAVMDMMLSRADGTPYRFYSLSSQILKSRKEYYQVLEDEQKGDGDITEWLLWFLQTTEKALGEAENSVRKAVERLKCSPPFIQRSATENDGCADGRFQGESHFWEMGENLPLLLRYGLERHQGSDGKRCPGEGRIWRAKYKLCDEKPTTNQILISCSPL